MSRPLRILHCPEVVGGMPGELARAERALGAESWAVAFENSVYDYPIDEVLYAPETGRLNREWRRNAKSYGPLVQAIDTPFAKAGDREWAWAAYSAILQRQIDEGIFGEAFSLNQMYVPLNAWYYEHPPDRRHHPAADAPLQHNSIQPRCLRVNVLLAELFNLGGQRAA